MALAVQRQYPFEAGVQVQPKESTVRSASRPRLDVVAIIDELEKLRSDRAASVNATNRTASSWRAPPGLPLTVNNTVNVHITGDYHSPPTISSGDRAWLQAVVQKEVATEDTWLMKMLGIGYGA